MAGNQHTLYRTEWNTIEIVGVSIVSAMFAFFLGLFILGKLQQYKFRRLPLVPVPEPQEYAFRSISYQIGKKKILNQLQGTFSPATLTAIMGPSGAGKSSLLDILAHKPKKGTVSGQFFLDGSPLRYPSRKFQHRIGFVDQEDVLLPWLTVAECLWFVADSRLPESMKSHEKATIIDTVLRDLHITDIRDTRIGGSGTFRGISGGERRRLSVAMELITSPCIIFLDEPTSGLDSYHAFKLMQILAHLAHDQGKTIVCTIHQPRQDVYALFDRVVLMAQGHILYQGPATESQSYFSGYGLPCPYDHHIADHMIDVAMQSDVLEMLRFKPSTAASSPYLLPSSIDDPGLDATSPRHTGYTLNLRRSKKDCGHPSKRIYQVSFLTQLNCLLGRNLKCLVRNQRLFLGHNIMAIVWGLFLGVVFYQSPLDKSGLQNRIGLFLFLQLLIAFTSFSALSSVACDRLLFMRERGNTYYRPTAYFVSKVTMDIIPLRIVWAFDFIVLIYSFFLLKLPTFLTGVIVFFMAGLQLSLLSFAKYISALLLFNIGTFAFCMAAGVLFADVGLGNFIASMGMLLSMLFHGLQLKLDLLPKYISWVQYFSLFRWTSEILHVNELRALTFKIALAGIEVDQAGDELLVEQFSMNLNAFTMNMCFLAFMDMVLLMIVGFFIVFKLREIR